MAFLQSFGQPVHRFEERQAVGLFRGQDVVRVHHLQAGAKTIDAAADEAFRTRRQCAGEVLVPAMEEHEFDHRCVVGAAHPPGMSGIAPRHVLEHIHHYGCYSAFRRIGEPGCVRAVDQAGREVEQDIDDAQARYLADQRREFGPDAVERAHVGE